MAKAILYVRVSSAEQREGFSIDAQLGLLREYCRSHGFDVIEEVMESQSAKSVGRRQFSRVLAMIREGSADHLVVEKLDRLTRNLRDLADVEDLVQKGLTLHLVKDGAPIHAESRSQDRLILGIKAVIAKNFSDNLSEEARKGMTEKASQGYWPTLAPTGYLNVQREGRRVIVPDPDQAPKVRAMFEAFASGDYSIRGVAKLARSMGVRTSQGGLVSGSRVEQLLRHPVYIGVVRWKGVEYPGVHEAIVPRLIWDRVQAVLATGAKPKSAKGDRFLFGGLVVCGVCGCRATPYLSKDHVYYACSGAKGCKRRGMREEAVEREIEALFARAQIRPDVLPLLVGALKEMVRAEVATVDDRRAVLNRERSRVMGKLESLIDARLENRVLEEAYGRLQTQYTDQLGRLNADIAGLDRVATKGMSDQVALLETLSNLPFVFKSALPAEKRELVKLALSNLGLVDGRLVITPRSWFKTLMECAGQREPEVFEIGESSKWQG